MYQISVTRGNPYVWQQNVDLLRTRGQCLITLTSSSFPTTVSGTLLYILRLSFADIRQKTQNKKYRNVCMKRDERVDIKYLLYYTKKI